MRHLWVLLLLPLASAGPGIDVPDDPSTTTLFVHLNAFQDAPLTTQEPPEWHSQSMDIGFVQHSQGCVDVPMTSVLSETHHTTLGFVNPGGTHYDKENGLRYGNEFGLSYDLLLDPAGTPILHWMLESQVTTSEVPAANELPILVPQVSVRAQLLEQHPLEPGAVVIAQGQSSPADLHPTMEHPEVTYHGVDGRHVYEVRTPMHLERDRVAANPGLGLRVDVLMDLPACNGDDYVMPDVVRLHSSADHRPRLEIDVLNPRRLDRIVPQFIGEDLIVHAAATSVWGTYDVAASDDGRPWPDALVTTPDGTVRALEPLSITGGFGVHGMTFTRPASYAWGWGQVFDEAAPGTHTVDVAFSNDQGTRTVQGTATFDVGDQTVTQCSYAPESGSVCVSSYTPLEDANTPGPGIVLLVGLLGAAFVRRR